MAVRPAKTQIRLGIRPIWSESLLSTWRNLGSLATHWAHSKDSDQTGRMPRLIWVFAGCTVILLVLSRGGSNIVTVHLESIHTWCFRYFGKTGSPSQNFLSVKNFSKCNPPDFIPVSQVIKNFPIWCNVEFSLLFCIVYCSENRLKINITPYWIFFLLLFNLPR